MSPLARLSLVALDCPDPHALAAFYSAITGWPVDSEHSAADWVQLQADTGATVAFQRVQGFTAPAWPGQEHPQQAHLDFDVPDLEAAEAVLLGLGARRHEVQPRPDEWRVYLDPAGHPFCLVRS